MSLNKVASYIMAFRLTDSHDGLDLLVQFPGVDVRLFLEGTRADHWWLHSSR